MEKVIASFCVVIKIHDSIAERGVWCANVLSVLHTED